MWYSTWRISSAEVTLQSLTRSWFSPTWTRRDTVTDGATLSTTMPSPRWIHRSERIWQHVKALSSMSPFFIQFKNGFNAALWSCLHIMPKRSTVTLKVRVNEPQRVAFTPCRMCSHFWLVREHFIIVVSEKILLRTLKNILFGNHYNLFADQSEVIALPVGWFYRFNRFCGSDRIQL